VRFAAAVAFGIALGGCAAEPPRATVQAVPVQPDDPLEPVNRKIFAFNQILDRILLKPLAEGYVAVVPEPGRDALRRVLDNMKEPTLFFNNALQGEVERAGITAGRFVVNTTLGLAGLVDVASTWKLPRQPADFGQTLFAWGVPSGPYLILPVLGPSNPRDAIGSGVDSYADPASLFSKIDGFEEFTISRFVADGIDRRARALDELDDLEKNSLDFYAALRSLSQQHRAAELLRGKAPEPGTGFYEDPAKAMPAGASPGADFYRDPAAVNLPAASPKP
jgi:phospholipid-binding lipoprotein MlaA